MVPDSNLIAESTIIIRAVVKRVNPIIKVIGFFNSVLFLFYFIFFIFRWKTLPFQATSIICSRTFKNYWYHVFNTFYFSFVGFFFITF